ncbi:MAG: hypothetical protein J6Y10_07545 [Lachnospiraceae bacterium]|nr:hypothetical protein [Lachnospiraceae bacterium]
MEEKKQPEKPAGRKKRWIIIAICVVIVILCVPMIQTYKDGGTVCYDAILYDVTDYNRELSKVERVNNTTLRYTHGMKKGVEIRILGFTVYDSTYETYDPEHATYQDGLPESTAALYPMAED